MWSYLERLYANLSNGMTVASVRCMGGNDAVVILW